MKTLRDTGILFGRSMRHILRSPDTIITSLFTPIGIMLLFVYVFGGVMQAGVGTSANYVNYQLPGILLMSIASAIGYTAMRLFTDVQTGLFARLHSMPVSRPAVLWANVLTSLVVNMFSVCVIILVALAMGFRSSAGILQWLGATGVLVLFTLALTWLAVIPGLTAKSVEGSYMFSYPLVFLPFLSSAFVPTATMPAALRIFAENQPVTSIVETLRALLDAQPVGNSVWVALGWCAGIIAVTCFLAMRAYRRATAGR